LNRYEQAEKGCAQERQEGGSGRQKEKTISHLPKKTKTALGKEGAKAAKKKRGGS
jgi:hypothetical protein